MASHAQSGALGNGLWQRRCERDARFAPTASRCMHSLLKLILSPLHSLCTVRLPFTVPGGTEYKIMIYYSGGGHDLEFGTVI